MNDDFDEALAQHSDLWTSGEWALSRHYHHQARVIFIFPSGRPTLRELQAVRAAAPQFADRPIHELHASLSYAREFLVGEFPDIDARRIRQAAETRGLVVRIEDTSSISYLPINVKHSHACIIEDDALARRVTDEMIRCGVPIIEEVEHD